MTDAVDHPFAGADPSEAFDKITGMRKERAALKARLTEPAPEEPKPEKPKSEPAPTTVEQRCHKCNISKVEMKVFEAVCKAVCMRVGPTRAVLKPACLRCGVLTSIQKACDEQCHEIKCKYAEA